MEKLVMDAAREGGMTLLSVLVAFMVLRSWLTKNSEALRVNTKEVNNLSHAIVKLELRLEDLSKLVGRVDRVERGVSILFEKEKTKNGAKT